MLVIHLVSLLLFSLETLSFFFFFNDTATTEIYTLSLHDALPISRPKTRKCDMGCPVLPCSRPRDRKSTRLNSSHGSISYAVFCLKKKKQKQRHPGPRNNLICVLASQAN